MMEQIFTDGWTLSDYALILSITCAQLFVMYSLSGSANPPVGLGLFTVYFMAALLGWIALSVQSGSGSGNGAVGIDVTAVVAIINSYLLFLACGQRSGIYSGRYLLGGVCLLTSLSVFFLPIEHMFLTQSAASAVFFAAAGVLSSWRGWRYRNMGDSIIALACVLSLIGITLAAYKATAGADSQVVRMLVFRTHSIGFALIVVGFLASALIEYQQDLSHLTTEDPLTRLFNRRGLGEALHVSLAAASRHGHTTSAILVDIDHFKQVNDSFGQEIGDSIIQMVANILSRLCRGSDVVARTGGEEFMLILPNTDIDAAKALGERIRVTIGDYPLLVEQQNVPVTASVGVASSQGQADVDGLYNEASRALFLAKRGGRNRVASVEKTPVQISAVKDSD
jgi:diguanylate cyclase (GGDEF)-like protein